MQINDVLISTLLLENQNQHISALQILFSFCQRLFPKIKIQFISFKENKKKVIWLNFDFYNECYK